MWLGSVYMQDQRVMTALGALLGVNLETRSPQDMTNDRGDPPKLSDEEVQKDEPMETEDTDQKVSAADKKKVCFTCKSVIVLFDCCWQKKVVNINTKWRVCVQNATYPTIEFWENQVFVFYCQCFSMENRIFMGASNWDAVDFHKNKVLNIYMILFATEFHGYLIFCKLAHVAFCKQTLQILFRL